jgi:putative spermidine/putrescine transport system substrate-binding protein
MADHERDGLEIVDLRCRAVARERQRLTRRELLKRSGRVAMGVGAASGLVAAVMPLGGRAQTATPSPAVPLPEITTIAESLKGSGEVTVCSYGGALQDAQRLAYFEPFEQLSGIRVTEAEGPDRAKIKAMVDTGNVEWDVAQLDRSDIITLEQTGDYWEEIDYSLFDTANIDESRRYRYSVDMLPYASILAYRTDGFPNPPQGWKDFWDTSAFPGARTMTAGGALSPDLEFALIADGVALGELYPLDIDRAFDSLSTIREHVVKYWDAGVIPAQMLSDNEAVLGVALNDRIDVIQAEGAPVAVQWNEGMLATDVWAIPKGAPNATNAQKFAAFITTAEAQARLSSLMPYGFVNNRSAEFLPAERLARLPTAPDIRARLFDRNVEWWVANIVAVTDRWNEWILG